MGKKAASSFAYCIVVFCTFIISLLLIMSAISGYINPANSSFMTTLGLITPILIIVNVIIAFIWLMKWKIWSIIPLIAIITNWNYLSAMFQFKFEDNQPTSGTIRVCTFNVRTFNNDFTGYSAKEIANYLRENNVNVFCAQEYSSSGNFNTDSVTAVFSKILRYSYVPNVKGRNGLAIFSNYPIIKHGFVPFKKTANCAMWCDIVKGNDTIRIFNAHLQTTSVSQIMHNADKGKEMEEGITCTLEASTTDNSKKRAQQALYLRNIIKRTNKPVILCGDFNDTPASFAYHTFKEFLTDGFKLGGDGYAASYRHFANLFRIDYIFVDCNFSVYDYHTDDREWSDHNPIIADIELRRF